MAEEKNDAQAPKKKTDLKSLLVSVFALLNLAGLGAGAFFTYKGTLGWRPPAITEADLARAAADVHIQTKDPLIYTFDRLTVNLSGQPQRMIRVEINVEMLSPDGFEEVINADNQAKVRHQVIELLTGRTFTEVESLQGKLFLKDEIAKAINKTLDRGVVKDVFFSEFVVQ